MLIYYIDTHSTCLASRTERIDRIIISIIIDEEIKRRGRKKEKMGRVGTKVTSMEDLAEVTLEQKHYGTRAVVAIY